MKLPKRRKYKVTVHYKTGKSVTFRCDAFEYSRAGGARSASWSRPKPAPLFLGLDDIESIWEHN